MDQIQVDETLMRIALEQAKEAAALDEVPIGAVIVRDGEVIARAHNLKEKTDDVTGHAELIAIRQASQKIGSWRLQDCDLYVTLEPCMMCAGAMIQSRIRRLIIGAKDPKSGMAGSVSNLFLLPANHKVEITADVLADECGRLLSVFFRRKRQEGE